MPLPDAAAQIFKDPKNTSNEKALNLCTAEDEKVAKSYEKTLKKSAKENLTIAERRAIMQQLEQTYRDKKKMNYLSGVLSRCKDEVDLSYGSARDRDIREFRSDDNNRSNSRRRTYRVR